MTFIDKSKWFEEIYAEVLRDEDITRQPNPLYTNLSDKEKDQLRQTQVFKGEIIQVLGVQDNFSLIRKYEGTLGWIPSMSIQMSDHYKNFEIPILEGLGPSSFLNTWKSVPYVFGGLSKQGIDCSGLTQKYFLHVFNLTLPKNSKDQRKLGVLSRLEALQDHDLIFCRPKSEPESHHVAIIYSGKIWHSRRNGGVVCQDVVEFVNEFNIEETRTLLNSNTITHNRGMEKQYIEKIKEVYEGINANNISLALNSFDVSIERHEPEGFPSSGIYRGIEQVKTHFIQARDTWAEGSCNTEQFFISGAKAVVYVHVHVRLKGKEDWIEGWIADGFRFKNEKIIEMRTFINREQALEWAGVQI